MNPTELYELWAPDISIWSNWVKPVLFAETAFAVSSFRFEWNSQNVPWAPSADSGSAIILDLPNDEAVRLGIALARQGYRPVPLYNGAPGPSAVIDVGRIIGALSDQAKALASLNIASTAPPVFLLDANRVSAATSVGPGKFDNRWVVFPQDFPSANFLKSKGIRSVVLGQKICGEPQQDLAHVLMRWQEAGLEILGCNVENQSPPQRLRVRRPNRFKSLWYRALVIVGLRRNSAGGFGAVVPTPSQSSGFG